MHFRAVLAGWLVLALALGFFAPKVETALSGAGWQASGSQSVQAREAIQKNFGGLGGYGLMVVVHSRSRTASEAAFAATVGQRRAHAALRAEPCAA